ncbi:response regulator transcription factor [Actinocorallia longicatena]|uniref:Response regulatory domain-containing protein n=1 Tax=Actinocorallia longicatena TaxID=111803 RepID=A0ABP6QDB4_9ACTN
MAVILVVDDDPDICDLVSLKFEQSGFDVITAGNGDDALELGRTKIPDLIVLDLMMPGMSGLDVCREFRKDPALDRVPVIMLTAKAQESDLEQGFAAGADDYVTKPFSPRELLTRARAVLARGRR